MSKPDDQPEKMSLASMDVAAEKRDELKRALGETFPEVFAEGSIDFDQLKRALGEWVDPGKERFGLSWPGKAECMKIIQQPSVATLKPVRAESVDFDTTENLFIEGDNLEVLKLLQKAYFGKVKLIYIDPPYNTGNEFIYPDKYAETLETYLTYTGQVDDEGRKFSTNTDASGRYHSRWLSMLFPRLYLARNLLRDDGVIFISIDDNEVGNLRKLCDEVFGEENFVECITWNKRIPKNDKGIGNIHEYVLIYLKNADWDYKFTMPKEGLEEVYELVASLKRRGTPIPDAENELRKLYNKKGYDRGITLYNSLDQNYRIWGKINVSWPNANTFGPRYDVPHPVTGKPAAIPDRGWRWKKETFDSLVDYKATSKRHDGTFTCGQIWFDKTEATQPSLIKYLDDVDTILLRSIISTKSDGGVEVESLFGGKNYFSYPKPTSLIETFIESFDLKDGDIVLDFFAGSGTTAHALMSFSARTNKRLNYLLIQLPEPVPENSEAHKAGYKVLSKLAAERIRRAAKSLVGESAGQLNLADSRIDFGLKAFKLDRSNFKVWEGSTAKDTNSVGTQIEMHVEHLSDASSAEDVLYELLLKAGFPLTTKVKAVKLAGKQAFSIENGALLICLEKEITPELIDALAEANPLQVICLDEGFKGNDQLKANAVQTFRARAESEESEIVFKTV